MAIGKRERIIEGLKILETYDREGDCCAEHDIFMGASPDVIVSKKDAKRLDELGWYYDGEERGWFIIL